MIAIFAISCTLLMKNKNIFKFFPKKVSKMRGMRDLINSEGYFVEKHGFKNFFENLGKNGVLNREYIIEG